MNPVIGIDLGTTNSVVAIVQNGQPRIIADPQTGDKILPSVVGVDPAGNLLVGQPALNQAVLFPEATVRSIKRKMGDDVTVQLGEKTFSPPEISAIILGRLRQWAEADLGCDVTQAVITVPAYFDDAQREATRVAGQIAGLDVMRIINEPTAAALVYEPDSQNAQRILVFDLGGGTFDVSIVAVEAGVVEVLATFGDSRLGGDDFDDRLCATLVQRFGPGAENLRANPAAMARLSIAAEAAKRRLSFDTFTQVSEEFLIAGDATSHLDTTVDRSDYETLIEPLLETTIRCVDSALEQAGLHAGQLDKVVLVGGSTRTPMVERLLIDRLDHRPSVEVDPDLCVALGAAVQGALLSGEQVHRALVDITPHSLGIRCHSDDDAVGRANHFAAIIPRGTALPCKRSETFFTSCHGQSCVDVEVFQGESSQVQHNRFVGRVELTGLSPHAPEESPVSITFRLNLNGMLEVKAVDRTTGSEAAATLDRTAKLDDDDDELDETDSPAMRIIDLTQSQSQIALMLGRDESPAKSGQAKPETGSGSVSPVNGEMLGRIAKLQESLSQINDVDVAEDRQEIDELLKQLQDAAASNDQQAFDAAAATLDDLLFYLQGT